MTTVEQHRTGIDGASPRSHTADEVFALVDDLYGRGLDAACDWLRARPGPPGQGAIVDAALQRMLTELVHDSRPASTPWRSCAA